MCCTSIQDSGLPVAHVSPPAHSKGSLLLGLVIFVYPKPTRCLNSANLLFLLHIGLLEGPNKGAHREGRVAPLEASLHSQLVPLWLGMNQSIVVSCPVTLLLQHLFSASAS